MKKIIRWHKWKFSSLSLNFYSSFDRMEFAKWILIVLCGLIFGSFGSVILFRLWKWLTWEKIKWFLVWRSECPHCHHVLSMKNLVPLLSFIFQKGKCSYCHQKISWVYPCLEWGTVLIFLLTFFLSPSWFEHLGLTFLLALFFWLCFLVAVYDFLYYELHLVASIWAFLLALLFAVVSHSDMIEFLFGIGIFFCMFLGIYFFGQVFYYCKYHERKEAFWFWDVLFSLNVGAIVPLFVSCSWGMQWMYLLLLFIISCCLFGLFLYTLQVFVQKKEKKAWVMIPFIPSMVVTLMIFVFFWAKILSFFY